MSNERDELAGIIARAFRVHPNGVAYVDHKGGADALLAAGYRKPRTITTAEELDALPRGAVVLSDVPAGSTAAGVPARVVSGKSPG